MTDVGTLTLSDFLLARIAEDEALVRVEIGRRDVVLVGPFAPARVLAKCEAERELIALADPYDFADDGGTGMSEHADKILRILARPYSGHPDYREAWAVWRQGSERNREARASRPDRAHRRSP